MKWFREMFSMDELKTSVTVFVLMTTHAFTLWTYYTKEDIPDSLLTLNLTLLGIVGGVNAVSMLGAIGSKKSKASDESK